MDTQFEDLIPLSQAGGAPWFGWWPGIVVDDVDPEKRGRIRVRVPQVYGAVEEEERIQDDELPWALPQQNAHEQTGEMWTPPVGSAVWVSFVAGSHEDPVFHGGWATQDDAIPEHVSSYKPGPTTRIVKTTNGHSFEMRWTPSEEQIKVLTALGVELCLIDATALGGPKVLLQTPAGFKLEQDEALGKITLSTPSGFTLLLDQTGTLASLATPGGNSLVLNDATTTVALTAAAIMLLSAGGAMTISAVALTLLATGLLSITGVGLALLTTGAAVTIGVAGSFQALATAQFVNTTFATHTHAVTTAPGVTGVPAPLPVPGDLTTNTLAN